MPTKKINYDTPQHAKDTVIRLCRLMKPQSARLCIIGLSIILYTALTIYTPFKSAEVIDAIWQSILSSREQGTAFVLTWDGLGKDILSLTTLYFFTWLFYYLQSFLMANVADMLVLNLRQQIAAKLNVLPLKFFDQNKSGEILSRVTNDLDKITETLQTGLLKLIVAVGTIIGSIAVMIYYNVFLTVIFLIFMAISMLMRFYEVNGGQILVDGIPSVNLTREGLRQNFGMVLQDTWLFGGTIAENIAYGKPDATREEIIAAAKAAKVDYFIRTMPQGYDTMLDNEGSNLSVGQRQLLTIARVFLCSPPILILDEATSSVDTRTETEINKAMQKLMKGRTSFVIAHRLSTIRDADIILFMENGNIIEQGNHAELLAKKGAYAALYYSQFA